MQNDAISKALPMESAVGEKDPATALSQVTFRFRSAVAGISDTSLWPGLLFDEAYIPPKTERKTEPGQKRGKIWVNHGKNVPKRKKGLEYMRIFGTIF